MRCFDCGRELEVGDRYIADTSSGFLRSLGEKPSSEDADVDAIMADIFGGADGKIIFCAECTEPGGDYRFETFYGDEPVGVETQQ